MQPDATCSLTLSWPERALSPNARVHWMVLYHAKSRLRKQWAWEAKAQGARLIDADRLHVSITFVPPSRRRYDLDNMLASIKAGLDGLADVWGVDDSKWTLTVERSDEVDGVVKVRVRKAKADAI